jgi:hypothetical protein
LRLVRLRVIETSTIHRREAWQRFEQAQRQIRVE